MEKQSPLRKYRRQPKLYTSLPSAGKWYNDQIIANNATSDLPVFSMTASDEIAFKTPDALINGEATAKSITSCMPSILDPWKIVSIDIDAILIAIRMATYGQSMPVSQKCPKCKHENAYDIDLQRMLDFFQTCEYQDTVYFDDFIVKLKPLNYRKWTSVQKTQMALRRTMYLQAEKIEDEEEKKKLYQTIIDQINESTVNAIIDQVLSIEVDEQIETDRNEIIEFLTSNDLGLFHKIKGTIEKNAINFQLPSVDVECEKCKAQNKVRVSLDSSDFFVKG